jgi:hypothetical protein
VYIVNIDLVGLKLYCPRLLLGLIGSLLEIEPF